MFILDNSIYRYGCLLTLGVIFTIFSAVESEPRSVARPLRPRCPTPEPLQHGTFRLRRMLMRVNCMPGFILRGPRIVECVHGKWLGEKPVCAKGGCYGPEDPENGRVQVERSITATLFCSDNYKTAGNRFAFCNGTHWDREIGNCREHSSSTEHECDFETEDICGWLTERSERYQWKRVMAANVFGSFHTGPRHDHTTLSASGGHYMLMESLGGSAPMSLTSPIYERDLSLKTACCFRFHYFMYGSGVGDLFVFVKPMSVNYLDMLTHKEVYIKFQLSGNQNNIWNAAHFTVDEMQEDFQIVFVATGGTSHLSDIAIDDVKLMIGRECKALDQNEDEPNEATATEMILEDTQSCVNRCTEAAPSGIIRRFKLIYGLCSCHADCEEDESCCPDFRAICLDDIFDESTPQVESTSANYNGASDDLSMLSTLWVENTTPSMDSDQESTKKVESEPTTTTAKIIPKIVTKPTEKSTTTLQPTTTTTSSTTTTTTTPKSTTKKSVPPLPRTTTTTRKPTTTTTTTTTTTPRPSTKKYVPPLPRTTPSTTTTTIKPTTSTTTTTTTPRPTTKKSAPPLPRTTPSTTTTTTTTAKSTTTTKASMEVIIPTTGINETITKLPETMVPPSVKVPDKPMKTKQNIKVWKVNSETHTGISQYHGTTIMAFILGLVAVVILIGVTCQRYKSKIIKCLPKRKGSSSANGSADEETASISAVYFPRMTEAIDENTTNGHKKSIKSKLQKIMKPKGRVYGDHMAKPFIEDEEYDDIVSDDDAIAMRKKNSTDL